PSEYIFHGAVEVYARHSIPQLANEYRRPSKWPRRLRSELHLANRPGADAPRAARALVRRALGTDPWFLVGSYLALDRQPPRCRQSREQHRSISRNQDQTGLAAPSEALCRQRRLAAA